MSVTLLRAYGGFATGAVATFADDTETALVAQGLATAGPLTDVSSNAPGYAQNVYQGGNYAFVPQGNQGYGVPLIRQGPSFLPNIPLGGLALTTFETNGVAQASGLINYAEIFVPHWATWTGLGVLNGTTVATGAEVALVALWGSNGVLIANSALAGAANAGASTFQNRAFVNAGGVATPVTLAPGRYFCGLQCGAGATDTFRHILALNCPNGTGVITGTVAGTFGTLPTLTIANTFTSAVGPIMQLYQ